MALSDLASRSPRSRLDTDRQGDHGARRRQHACTRAAHLGAAGGLPGFVYAPAPPLATEQDHRNLIGRKVLIAHERTKTLEPGWYTGRIKLFGVSASWKKSCPSSSTIRRRRTTRSTATRRSSWRRSTTSRRVVAAAGRGPQHATRLRLRRRSRRWWQGVGRAGPEGGVRALTG